MCFKTDFKTFQTRCFTDGRWEGVPNGWSKRWKGAIAIIMFSRTFRALVMCCDLRILSFVWVSTETSSQDYCQVSDYTEINSPADVSGFATSASHSCEDSYWRHRRLRIIGHWIALVWKTIWQLRYYYERPGTLVLLLGLPSVKLYSWE